MRSATRTRLAVIGAGLLLSGAGLTWTACGKPGGHKGSSAAIQKARYHCPMHPTYVSDGPGDCPICGMRLVPIAAADAPAATAAPATAPGERSIAGRAVVALSPERRQMLGIRSEPVREQPIEYVIRTVGRVAPDETRIHHVHTKYEAYVEHLYVDFTGKFVRRGDPLVALFSAELLATQEEYLLAVKARDRLAQSDQPGVARGAVDLLEATRQRLLLWDIAPADIAEIERTGKAKRALDLHSDVSGYVLQKTAVHGMRVMPTDTLFDIANLSRLWVLADVYVSDLSSIRLGMRAEVSAAYLPGQTWRGPVTYIAPTVDEKTRTVKVRVEVDNRAATLKPDMYADVLLRVDRGRGLVVPDSAVIDAGDRKLVFVDRADGRLEPRQVETGAALADGVQVLSGLAPGERVVTSANFLLDSESSLKAALSAMAAPTSGGTPAPAPGHRH